MAIVINTQTGEIDLDQTDPGTYVVTYTVQGVSSTQEVTVNAVDNATFSYSANSYTTTDPDPTPTITGLTGGTFSGTTGLVINSTTGEIDLSASTVATHTITYNTSSSGSSVCPNTSTQTVEIALAGIANNYSMNFDSASSDYISFPATPDTGDLSISFWVKYSTGHNCQVVSGDGIFNTLRFRASYSKLSFRYANVYYDLTTDIKDGNWHHVVVTYDQSTATVRGYTDGSLSETHTNKSGGTNSNIQTIGASTTGSYPFNGQIDEVGVWNTVLTDGTGGTVNQIAEIYNATSTNLTKDLTTVSGSNLVYWNRMGD
jgi:hypothetical protein